MRKRSLTIAFAAIAFSAASLGWLGCTTILGNFSDGTSDAGSDVFVADAPVADHSVADVDADDASNCTMTGTCAPGYPCTSATQCASGVCTSGMCAAPQCAADASCALGTACENGGSCASGDCVDGVCCGSAECPACLNCGATGQCNVVVSGMDDLSATSCTGNSTCTTAGACVQRWSVLGMSPTVGYFDSAYTAALGNYLYFGYTASFVSFDITNNAFSNEPHDSGMCWCGYPGPVTAGTSQLFILADGVLDSWLPGAGAWSAQISGEPGNIDGSAFATLGGELFAMGGTYNSPVSSAWVATPTSTAWTAIASMPSANAGACAGVDAANGKIYVFGGQNGSSGSMAVYTQSNNTWAQVTAPGTPSCNYTTVPSWEGNMVFADYQGVHVFNYATQAWGATLPLPTGASLQAPTALVPGDGHLYLVAYDGTNDIVYKWNLN